MDLLIAASAADRLGTAITFHAPGTRLLRLERTGEVRGDGLPEAAWLSLDVFAEGLLQRFIDVVDRSPSLRWLQTVHAGLDLPLYANLLVRRVRLCNSHAHAPAIGEFVLGHVLSLLQQHEHVRRFQDQRRWQHLPFRELAGTRWLVIGVGHVGTEVARRALACGAIVAGVRRRAASHDLIEEIVAFPGLRSRLAEADVVVLACPITEETRGLANAGFFAGMQPGSIFVNVARGGLVDEGALLAGLERGRPAYAVLDVASAEPLPPENPLWRHDRVRITAHSAFAGSGTPGRSDLLFLDNLRRYGAGEPLREEVTSI